MQSTDCAKANHVRGMERFSQRRAKNEAARCFIGPPRFFHCFSSGSESAPALDDEYQGERLFTSFLSSR